MLDLHEADLLIETPPPKRKKSQSDFTNEEKRKRKKEKGNKSFEFIDRRSFYSILALQQI